MANYQRWLDRIQVLERKIRPSSVYLLLVVLVAFALGGLTYSLWSDHNRPVPENNTEQLSKLNKQLNIQAQTLAAKNLELALSRETNEKMQDLFVEQHSKEKDLHRELAFYRSIMAPESIADGVAINGLEFTPSLLPSQYRLKLILTQLQKRKQSLKGRAEFTFVGVQDGKVVELSLAKLTGDKSLNFQFRYFQVLEAEITLPESFKLSRILAKVIVPSSRWAKGSQAEMEFSALELLPDASNIEPDKIEKPVQ
ncbi:hypothetical protein Sps_02527 [Shewanella psychrophila]|uniref:Uncharacterized protein n=1 Tax=Shewanella psychrophila TaxID=225848 RepID=A0A1S6HQ98_9GAMM|nr:DUF6776 family protein [Shewanella psychrophila]AQS37681.1 hypothetical protein Sps_02527 [Shewanella psychrophila]